MPLNRGTRRYIRPWNPLDLGAALNLWLDANDLNTLVLNGTNVSAWRDKSLAGNTVIQPTAANQPGYVAPSSTAQGIAIPAGVTTTVNTTPTLQTPGNAVIPLGAVPRFGVICETLNSTTVVNTPGEMSLNWGLRNGTVGGACSFGAATNDPQYVGFSSNVDSAQARNINRNIKTFYYDGSTMLLFKNGLAVGGFAGFGVNTLAAPLSIGGSAGFNYYFKGIMHGYVVAAARGFDLMQRVEGWMSRTYGVQLASSHPYARSRPTVAMG